ncbi:heavy metal translocating P-type ATPase [uncultured Ruminococcus sp.]|uniref:heavy metal translocating P-type ATPase n=1 Tax=uncultured Ruminococcus sp. TaxID=165186 RepID=UPI0025D1F647|nr:heavy metal translocating P-type ATPase [uncultured Ruminococcus sp.]
MKCEILHESRGRIRVHCACGRMTLHQADILEYYLRAKPFVTNAKVYDRTGDAVIWYDGERGLVIKALGRFSFADESAEALVPEHTGRELDRDFENRLIAMIVKRVLKRTVLPMPIRFALTVINAFKHIKEALKALARGSIEVSVLDAAAITVSLIRKDHDTASSVMFMLGLGELLEEWTRKKSVDELASVMSLGIDKVWLIKEGKEELVPTSAISEGDEVIVRTGSMIPLDGVVVSGEAEVNQSSLTGESLPVHKAAGSYVYAGTVVEDGSCIVRVDKTSGSGKYDRIVKMIEESEKLKSQAESKAVHLADKLVPYSLAATVLTYLLTGDSVKAISILMVDYSCALKLAIPISVISAMRESSVHGITVKGGKFLEAVSEADTIVFDKTGTLTHSAPHVAKIFTFGGNSEEEVLRLAACLEEHYPHSIANAVFEEAKRRGIDHEEKHSTVEYVVAHGISSSIDGKKAVIGSYHFVFEDEACVIPQGEQERFDALPPEYSHLFLAVGGELAAVLCIEDPLREEAAEVVSQLRELGFEKIVMMTGDSKRVAKCVAEKVGVDELYYEVLPEDKAEYVRKQKAEGRKVIMIGDGVNDSPALSEADAGIAISSGAAIAKEIADITISADDLYCLLTLRKISRALMDRIERSYRFIMTFNSALMALGALGIIAPTTSALLHNGSTIAISLSDMRAYLP